MHKKTYHPKSGNKLRLDYFATSARHLDVCFSSNEAIV